MDQNERQVIDGLFSKLRQVDQQAPQRDAEAEAHIRQQVAAMPTAPYYMAQALLVQEQALTNLQTRIQQLEREATQRPRRRRSMPRSRNASMRCVASMASRTTAGASPRNPRSTRSSATRARRCGARSLWR